MHQAAFKVPTHAATLVLFMQVLGGEEILSLPEKSEEFVPGECVCSEPVVDHRNMCILAPQATAFLRCTQGLFVAWLSAVQACGHNHVLSST